MPVRVNGGLVESLWFESKLDPDAASGAPGARGITVLTDEGAEERLEYVALLERARGVAAALRAAGVAPGDAVLVIVPTSTAFVLTFFGLWLAGAVPAPLPLPTSFGDMEGFAERLLEVARKLGARRLVASHVTAGMIPGLGSAGEAAPAVLLAEDLVTAGPAPAAFETHRGAATDRALIQCTSASTGPPKGVVLTHENLISNVHQIGHCLEVRPGDVPICWLPLYHDMGLIGCLLFSTYWNLDSVYLSPFRFLRRPASWLQAISRYRGSISPAPNFAYAYVTARAKEDELRDLDLSSLRIALCGAEPVDPRALERFEERFAPHGLPRPCVTPCYGLAEGTLAVSFHALNTPLVFDRVDREALARGEVRDSGAPNAVLVASCGRPVPEARVRILAEDGSLLAEDRVGRIQVSGPSIMQGYHGDREATSAALQDGWLETGDQGYLRRGELRITGRSKDIVIIRGRNYSPSDFEWAAEEVPGVRRGNVVAFGVPDEASGTEALVLVCETDLEGDARAALERDVRSHVAERTSIVPSVVSLVPRNTVPKTSSGKLQRGKMRGLYLMAAAWGGPGSS